MHIAGHAWSRNLGLKFRSNVSGPVYGEEYLSMLESAPIQLGFLNSDNRDKHTARTFELPASGALFLAERSEEHLELFEDGKEAVFFSEDAELHEKLSFLLANPNLVDRIRIKGMSKVIQGNNSWVDRARYIMQTVTRSN
jgi:hypothetical protein